MLKWIVNGNSHVILSLALQFITLCKFNGIEKARKCIVACLPERKLGHLLFSGQQTNISVGYKTTLIYYDRIG